ncbi:MAG: DUF1499 domain-containing protein [Gemmatimonadales bacterium]|jgi:uncharacterized protein (DUF1499 family)
MAFRKIWKSLTENTAQTSEQAEDPRLRGRTYLVPFATVWDQITAIIESRSRWRLVSADEGAGLIHAEAKTLVLRLVDDVRFKVKLDQNALTRVDMWSASRVGKGDLGVNARRIRRFYRRLDRELGVRD